MMRKCLRNFSSLSSPKVCSVIPIPLSFGQPLHGPDRAPSLLVKHGLYNAIANCGYSVKPVPDVLSSLEISWESGQSSVKNVSIIGKVSERVKAQVEEEASSNNFLLILGGDHSIPLGTFPGILARRPRTGIVWVDAHADINTPETSPSGNMHGMPLAFLLGLVKDANKYPSLGWFSPCLDPKDIVYIGLRDVDPGEKKLIRDLGIRAYTMYDIDRFGIGRVMDECLSYFGDRDSIHLSFDVDGLDPFYAPSTGTTVRGGLTFREGNFICEVLAESGKLNSMELVEINPILNSAVAAQETIEMSLSLIGSSLGQRIL